MIISKRKKEDHSGTTTIYKFSAVDGNREESLFIENGEIIMITSKNAFEFSIIQPKSYDYKEIYGSFNPTQFCASTGLSEGFENQCFSTIKFIVDKDPTELRKIYNTLSDETYKKYCKEIQKEKIAELKF